MYKLLNKRDCRPARLAAGEEEGGVKKTSKQRRAHDSNAPYGLLNFFQ